MPLALITGVGGQDGSLLAELLVDAGYEVVGTTRRPPREYPNLEALRAGKRLAVECLELPEVSEVALRFYQPDEIYNFAAPSFVPDSWLDPGETARLTALSAINLFEAARAAAPAARIYQASSSEIFGVPEFEPQDEHTPLRPVTPYGAAKAYAHHMAQVYRRQYGMFICCGIAYNHESPRRGEHFLPQKVARAAAAISLGLENELLLGNVYARRDWGYAPDYVRAMHLMLEQRWPGDYVLASGKSWPVARLCKIAFARTGLDWREYVQVKPEMQRGKDELVGLVGNATRAQDVLGWEPTIEFSEMIATLVDAQLKRLRQEMKAPPSDRAAL